VDAGQISAALFWRRGRIWWDLEGNRTMSVWEQSWAYEQRLGKWRETKGAKKTWKGDPGAKSVLAALATFADEMGYAYCGQETLAEMTDMTERSVREHLHNLEHA